MGNEEVEVLGRVAKLGELNRLTHLLLIVLVQYLEHLFCVMIVNLYS